VGSSDYLMILPCAVERDMMRAYNSGMTLRGSLMNTYSQFIFCSGLTTVAVIDSLNMSDLLGSVPHIALLWLSSEAFTRHECGFRTKRSASQESQSSR
jgi:hypothetical protein